MNAQQVFSCDWSAGGCRTVGWETKCTDGSRYYTPNANAPPRPGKYNVQDHINKNDAWLSPSSTRPDSSSSRRDALFNETWNCSANMVVAEVPTAANVTAQSSDSDVAEGEEVLEDNGGGASDADYSITTRMIVVNNTLCVDLPHVLCGGCHVVGNHCLRQHDRDELLRCEQRYIVVLGGHYNSKECGCGTASVFRPDGWWCAALPALDLKRGRIGEERMMEK